MRERISAQKILFLKIFPMEEKGGQAGVMMDLNTVISRKLSLPSDAFASKSERK